MLHHNFRKGTRILIIFRDGIKLDCKFLDRKARSMLTDKGEFLFKTMRATTIFKHKEVVQAAPNMVSSGMIYYVRHGQTPNNVKRIFYKEEEEVGLNDQGFAQADKTAEELKDIKFDICYCSPRKRAVQTAQQILKYHPNVKVVYDKRIWERIWGEVSGLPVSLVEPNRWYRYAQFNYKGIETVDEVFARAKSFYDEIKHKHAGQTILVVSHGGFGRVTHCYFHGFPDDNDLSNIELKNAEFAKFEM